jgi:Domain of unknown function (DUF1854).
LVFTAADGSVSVGVAPVRAFPISAPDDGLSLVGADGHELAWIAKLTNAASGATDAGASRAGATRIHAGHHPAAGRSGFATPSTWTVQTDRGDTQFVLKAEDDIRRLGSNRLMIADRHGVHYLIRDLAALDKHSRKLLDRFL